MNFLMNRAYIDIKCLEVYKYKNGVRVLGEVLRNAKVKVIVFINSAKFEVNKLAVNGLYSIEGYFKSTRAKVGTEDSLVDLVAESVKPVLKLIPTAASNRVQITGYYGGVLKVDVVNSYSAKQKTSQHTTSEEQIAHVAFNPILKSLLPSDIVVIAWNKLIEILEYTKLNSKIHLMCALSPVPFGSKPGPVRMSIFSITRLK